MMKFAELSFFRPAWTLFITLSGGLIAGAGEYWPQFRGPDALGVAEGANLPVTWSATQNVVWKTAIPGNGWSSPIVWGDKIFLTSVVKEGEVETPRKGLYFGGERPNPSQDLHRWMVFCLDWTTGRIFWEREAHRGAPSTPVHLKNTYASETPVTDGERVYAYFGNLGLFCFDFDGRLIWSEKMGAYKMRHGWGTAASPVLHQDRLYIVHDNEESSYLAAFDTKSGKMVWRVEREEPSNWATPYIWENDLRTEIVTPGRNKVRSYDLNGQLLWHFGGMSSIVIPTPFSKFGLLYVTSGYVGDRVRPVFVLRPGASGDISLEDAETSHPHVAWYESAAGPYNPSPLVYGDHFYVLYDFGFLACRDARSGKELYEKQRLNTEGTAAFTASPWAYRDKVFCLSEDGDTYVVEAGPSYRLLHKNPLGEMCMATPAMARDSLLIRTLSQLYRIQEPVASREGANNRPSP